MYSKLLYEMSASGTTKTRMTFRLAPALAAALRELPSQTLFVERALREALGRLCPLCQGTGQVSEVHLAVSDLKGLRIPRLDRSTAAELKALIRLGRQLLATQLEIRPAGEGPELGFRLAREDQLLLEGRIPRGEPGTTRIRVAH